MNLLESTVAQQSRSRSGDSNEWNVLQAVSDALQGNWRKLAYTLSDELEQYSTMLTDIYTSVGALAAARHSRGLINIVSDAGKYLFGFSTEKDVSALSKKINVLASQAGTFKHIADQQFSYIKDVATQVLKNGKKT